MASADAELLSDGWSIVERGDAMARVPLRVEAALERGAATMTAGELKAVLSLVAPPTDGAERAPLRLVAVLDKSGSMHGEKLRLVKETMLFMLRHLSKLDALGIVEYGTEVKVAAPLTYCSEDGRGRLDAVINRLQTSGHTNLSGGLLRGLQLHGSKPQDASAVPPAAALQRLRFGNTYRRLSDEEAGEREHHGHPGACPPSGAQCVHEWTMSIRFESPEDESLVRKVVYELHETFRDPVVEVFEAPFQLTRFGWGTFVVSARVHLRDGRSFVLQHKLSFDRPETFQTLLLPLRSAPAGLDYIVNGVKKVRVTELRLDDGVCSLRNPAAQGQTLHMNGVSYGNWRALRRTTVPAEQPDVPRRIMALFEGRSAEDRVEFVDTDGDKIVFLSEEQPFSDVRAEAAENVDGAVVRSTFLFTDGLANVGITKSEKLCAAAQSALGELGGRQCSLSTFGFGKDHNADLLQGLAEAGGGIYSYVEGEDRIGEAFGEALGGLLSTTHQNVCLSFKLAAGVGLSRAFTAYPVEGPDDSAEGADRTVRVDLGDLFAEERRDVLVALSLPQASAEGPQVLGHFSARGFSVLSNCTEVSETLALTVERQGCADTAAPRHPQVERHLNRHRATEALEAARVAAQRGDLAAARGVLATASEALGSSPLTASGDQVCIGLLTDLNECSKDLRREEDYRAYGSKKMACMQGAHMKQRACFGQDFSEGYSNASMLQMKAVFKERCK